MEADRGQRIEGTDDEVRRMKKTEQEFAGRVAGYRPAALRRSSAVDPLLLDHGAVGGSLCQKTSYHSCAIAFFIEKSGDCRHFINCTNAVASYVVSRIALRPIPKCPHIISDMPKRIIA